MKGVLMTVMSREMMEQTLPALANGCFWRVSQNDQGGLKIEARKKTMFGSRRIGYVSFDWIPDPSEVNIYAQAMQAVGDYRK